MLHRSDINKTRLDFTQIPGFRIVYILYGLRIKRVENHNRVPEQLRTNGYNN